MDTISDRLRIVGVPIALRAEVSYVEGGWLATSGQSGQARENRCGEEATSRRWLIVVHGGILQHLSARYDPRRGDQKNMPNLGGDSARHDKSKTYK